MSIKLGMVMDSIDQINIKKDTSFAMLLEAQSRGWQLYYMEMGDLFLRNGRAYARTRLLTVERNASRWHEFIREQIIDLSELDVILMRKDPPFDSEFLYALFAGFRRLMFSLDLVLLGSWVVMLLSYFLI